MTRMVADAPLPLDHVRDPIERPEIGGVASGQRTLQECPHEARALAQRQLGWAARNRLGSKAWKPCPLVGVVPAHDRTVRTAQLLGNRRRRQAPLSQLDGASATPLQLAGAARRSHASQYRAEH